MHAEYVLIGSAIGMAIYAFLAIYMTPIASSYAGVYHSTTISGVVPASPFYIPRPASLPGSSTARNWNETRSRHWDFIKPPAPVVLGPSYWSCYNTNNPDHPRQRLSCWQTSGPNHIRIVQYRPPNNLYEPCPSASKPAYDDSSCQLRFGELSVANQSSGYCSAPFGPPNNYYLRPKATVCVYATNPSTTTRPPTTTTTTTTRALTTTTGIRNRPQCPRMRNDWPDLSGRSYSGGVQYHSYAAWTSIQEHSKELIGFSISRHTCGSVDPFVVTTDVCGFSGELVILYKTSALVIDNPISANGVGAHGTLYDAPDMVSFHSNVGFRYHISNTAGYHHISYVVVGCKYNINPPALVLCTSMVVKTWTCTETSYLWGAFTFDACDWYSYRSFECTVIATGFPVCPVVRSHLLMINEYAFAVTHNNVIRAFIQHDGVVATPRPLLLTADSRIESTAKAIVWTPSPTAVDTCLIYLATGHGIIELTTTRPANSSTYYGGVAFGDIMVTPAKIIYAVALDGDVYTIPQTTLLVPVKCAAPFAAMFATDCRLACPSPTGIAIFEADGTPSSSYRLPPQHTIIRMVVTVSGHVAFIYRSRLGGLWLASTDPVVPPMRIQPFYPDTIMLAHAYGATFGAIGVADMTTSAPNDGQAFLLIVAYSRAPVDRMFNYYPD